MRTDLNLATFLIDERVQKIIHALSDEEKAKIVFTGPTYRDGEFEALYHVSIDRVRIAEFSACAGRIVSVIDFREQAAAPKIIGLGQGINRFVGMCVNPLYQ